MCRTLSNLLGIWGGIREGGAGCRGNGAEGVVFFNVGDGLIGRLVAGLEVGVMAKATRELVALASRCMVLRSFSTFSRGVR